MTKVPDSILEVNYQDPKADKIPQFGMISNFMWRRANFVLKNIVDSNQKVMILDPCAGGGRLLSKANKGFELKGYEPDYQNWWYGRHYLSVNFRDCSFINDCFESHFADSYGPGFHLVISMPDTNRHINAKYETNPDYLKCTNYAFYVMSRSIDVLLDKGVGVFCIPKEYVENEKYVSDVENIMKKADIISVESYEQFSIVVFQKKKA